MQKIFKGFVLGLIVLIVYTSYNTVENRKRVAAESQIEFVEELEILSVIN